MNENAEAFWAFVGIVLTAVGASLLTEWPAALVVVGIAMYLGTAL